MQELDSLEEGFVTNYDPNDPRFPAKSYFQAVETEMKPKKGRRGDDLDEDDKAGDNYYFDEDADDSGEIGYNESDGVPLPADKKEGELDSQKEELLGWFEFMQIFKRPLCL